MDNNLQEKIHNLIEVLYKWDEDLSNLNIKRLNNSYYDIASFLINKNYVNVPNNFPAFIRFLNEKKINTFAGSEGIGEETLLNERILLNGRLNPKLKQWYKEIESLKEAEQKAMLDFLFECRKYRGTEKEAKYCDFYREGRGLVSKDNNIITNIQFKALINNRFPRELREIIQRWRKDININSEEISVCPVCGKIIDNSFGHENYCSDICQYYMDKDNLIIENIKIDISKQYSEFTNGIYQYILLPNIGEKLIYEHLLQFSEIEVEISPNMDEYDIRIQIDDKVINVDVKDVSNPSTLVELLKQKNGIKKLLRSRDEKRYLVIPNHRKSIFKRKENRDYKKTLKNIFYNEGIDIEVIYESELYKKIEKILENYIEVKDE